MPVQQTHEPYFQNYFFLISSTIIIPSVPGMEPIPFDNMHGLDDVEAEVEEEEHFPLQTCEEEIPSGRS